MAWQHIPLEVIVKGVEKFCISCTLDETDDNMLWNGSEEDGNVRNECEDEGSECADGDTDTDWKM
jgi:hypothetical protein